MNGRQGNNDRLLDSVGWFTTHGRNLRHFTIDPTGDFLSVANQDSDWIVVFQRDLVTGPCWMN